MDLHCRYESGIVGRFAFHSMPGNEALPRGENCRHFGKKHEHSLYTFQFGQSGICDYSQSVLRLGASCDYP